jgi:cold shock protein
LSAIRRCGGVNRQAFLRCPSQESANIGIP